MLDWCDETARAASSQRRLLLLALLVFLLVLLRLLRHSDLLSQLGPSKAHTALTDRQPGLNRKDVAGPCRRTVGELVVSHTTGRQTALGHMPETAAAAAGRRSAPRSARASLGCSRREQAGDACGQRRTEAPGCSRRRRRPEPPDCQNPSLTGRTDGRDLTSGRNRHIAVRPVASRRCFRQLASAGAKGTARRASATGAVAADAGVATSVAKAVYRSAQPQT